MKIQYVLFSKITCFLSGWISVNKRLPKHKNKNVSLGILCFCLLQGYYPAVCLFSPSDKRWVGTSDHGDVTEFVSHWKYSKAPGIFFDEWIIQKRTNNGISLW